MQLSKKLMFIGVLSLLPYQAMADTAPAADGSYKEHHVSHFDKLDTNHDGMISKEEFMAEAEARFAEIDANHDGTISKDEWEAHRQKMKEMYGHGGKHHHHDQDGSSSTAAPAAPAQ